MIKKGSGYYILDIGYWILNITVAVLSFSSIETYTDKNKTFAILF